LVIVGTAIPFFIGVNMGGNEGEKVAMCCSFYWGAILGLCWAYSGYRSSSSKPTAQELTEEKLVCVPPPRTAFDEYSDEFMLYRAVALKRKPREEKRDLTEIERVLNAPNDLTRTERDDLIKIREGILSVIKEDKEKFENYVKLLR
jgi:hypothetical protein